MVTTGRDCGSAPVDQYSPFNKKSFDVSETGKFYWQYNIKALRNNLLDHMLKVPEREHWKTFSKPTFILGGELSGYIPLDSHQAIREHFPNATFDYVSNAGHWVYADNPREFSRKLIAFLKDQES